MLIEKLIERGRWRLIVRNSSWICLYDKEEAAVGYEKSWSFNSLTFYRKLRKALKYFIKVVLKDEKIKILAEEARKTLTTGEWGDDRQY